jgi:hypothetical protein
VPENTISGPARATLHWIWIQRCRQSTAVKTRAQRLYSWAVRLPIDGRTDERVKTPNYAYDIDGGQTDAVYIRRRCRDDRLPDIARGASRQVTAAATAAAADDGDSSHRRFRRRHYAECL